MSRRTNAAAALAKVKAAAARGKKPPKETPQTLPWDHIKIIEEVFQRRGPAVGYARAAFIDELSREVKRRGSAGHLEPVVVWWCGAWLLVDGHHRMAAVKKGLSTAAEVPVVVFEGSLEAALGASVGLNRKTKLAMSASERVNAAWFLTVNAPGLSKAQVMEDTGASDGIVAKQRRVLRILLERQRAGDDLAERQREPSSLGWREAMAAADGRAVQAWDAEEGRQAAVDSIRRTLSAALGKEIATNPEAFLEALRQIAPELSVAESEDDPDQIDVGGKASGAWHYVNGIKVGEQMQREEVEQERRIRAIRKALLAAARKDGVDDLAAAELLRAASGPALGAIAASAKLPKEAPMPDVEATAADAVDTPRDALSDSGETAEGQA